jgi:hypothetical protein
MGHYESDALDEILAQSDFKDQFDRVSERYILKFK